MALFWIQWVLAGPTTSQSRCRLWFYGDTFCGTHFSNYSYEELVGPTSATQIFIDGGFLDNQFLSATIEQHLESGSAPHAIQHTLSVGPSSTGPWTQVGQYTLTSAASGTVITPCMQTTAPPPSPCAYGTRASSTAGTVAVMSQAAIDAALAAIGAPWLSFMFAPLIGEAVATGSICQTLPPAVPNFVTTDLLATVYQKAAWLNSIMWWTLCECVPAPSGQPPPVTPTKPTLTQPPDFPQYGPYTCTNSDICATLLVILKRLDGLNQSQTVNVDARTTVYSTPRGVHYTTGTVHAGLTGSASLPINNLAGVRVTVTSSPSGEVLPGNPQYLWDQGWMSVSDGAALLMERRIARASSEWLPPEMNLATTFGYWLHPGVVITMTELVPA